MYQVTTPFGENNLNNVTLSKTDDAEVVLFSLYTCRGHLTVDPVLLARPAALAEGLQGCYYLVSPGVTKEEFRCNLQSISMLETSDLLLNINEPKCMG